MSAHALPFFTPEEYLEMERAAETKSEYYDGQIFAMSSGPFTHSAIGAGIIAALIPALRGKKCEVATSDLKVRIAQVGPFVYPDAIVYCGEPELPDGPSKTWRSKPLNLMDNDKSIRSFLSV
ncbi:MAG: Uma2 family endonuclease [Bryobacteraceae bacterium]|jgi:Uma2 family endonuclease